MKLTYRGVSYDYTPPTVETKVTGEVGKFRGVDIRFRTIQRAPVQQSTLDLMYRGAAYRANNQAVEPAAVGTPTAMPQPAGLAQASVSTDDKARMAMMNRHRSVEQRQQSMLARLSTEAGLPIEAT